VQESFVVQVDLYKLIVKVSEVCVRGISCDF